MAKPTFKKGRCVVRDYAERKLELTERTWQHITRDRNRDYFVRQFDKIARTIEEPDRVIESSKEKAVMLYERFFDDFFIANTVIGRAYIYVVVNWRTCVIRTVYANPRKQKRGKVLWARK